MNMRTPLIISAVLIAAMLAGSAWASLHLPPGTPIPIHWNIEGQPDRYATGWYAVYMAPAMAALITVLFVAIPWLEPRRLNLAKSGKFYAATWIAVIALMAATHGLALYATMHKGAPIGGVVIGAVSLLIVVVGNYLGKTRSMFLGGVRTPWTLSSEYSWQRTHSLAGKLFMLSGGLGFVSAIALPSPLAAKVFLVAIAASVVFSIIASYFYWLRDPERAKDDAAAQ